MSGTGTSPGRGDWKETLGRVGLVGKGVLFAVIGLLAIQLATGDASGDATKNGAIEWVAGQPLGKFLLVALTIALFALAAWRLLDAAFGDPVEGSEATDRVKFAVTGVVYLALAIAALTATIANWTGSSSSGSSGSGGTKKQATSTVLEWPGGRFLVIAIGLAVAGYAIYMVKKHVVDAEFAERLSVGEEHWVTMFGRVGYAARAIVYVLVGYFLVQAGINHQAGQTKGMSGSLKALSGEGWGQLVLWGVAVGLLTYGLFTMAEAKFRRAA